MKGLGGTIGKKQIKLRVFLWFPSREKIDFFAGGLWPTLAYIVLCHWTQTPDNDTPLIVSENHIIQCNYMCPCRTQHMSDIGTRIIPEVYVLHRYQVNDYVTLLRWVYLINMSLLIFLLIQLYLFYKTFYH